LAKITTSIIKQKKLKNEKITMLTSYDYCFAKIVDEAGIDIVLVGDSLGMVFAGEENTLSVTLEQMIYHTKAVKRAVKNAFVVIDMPFLTYHVSIEKSIENCGKAIKESGAEAVKIEGGINIKDTIKALTNAGIPVMGHIGMTPQKVNKIGGYRRMGKTESEKRELLEDAKSLEEAGVFAIVIEFTKADVAKKITESVTVPTICIGAGPYCDGQVLVIHDILGLSPFIPPFAKRYVDLPKIIKSAVEKYSEEVRNGVFPGEEYYK